jgi:hypothetical protein
MPVETGGNALGYGRLTTAGRPRQSYDKDPFLNWSVTHNRIVEAPLNLG